MSKTVQGIFRNGRVEFPEDSSLSHHDGPVLVTFLEPGEMPFLLRGITTEEAAAFRSRLSTFIEDWESPEMDVYDDYDTFKSQSNP